MQMDGPFYNLLLASEQFTDYLFSLYPPGLKHNFTLELMMEQINEENILKIFNYMTSNFPKEEYGYLYEMIAFFSRIRPFAWKSLGLLFAHLNKVYPFDETLRDLFIDHSTFGQYLIKMKIISEKFSDYVVPTDWTAIELEAGYKQDTLEYILKYDDIESFQKRCAVPQFTFDKLLEFGPSFLDIFSFCAYFGALKCFKFSMMNAQLNAQNTCSWAVKGGNVEIVRHCQRSGADMKNCLPATIEYHWNQITRWLLQNYECDPVPLGDCIGNFNTRGFLFFLTQGAQPELENEEGWSPLQASCITGHVECCKYLILKGVSLEANEEGENNISPLIIASSRNHETIVKLLVENGADIDYQGEDGWSGILSAAKNGATGLVKYFCEKGADVESCNLYGWTSLFMAAFYNYHDMIKYLIEFGANVDSKTSDGKGLLDICRNEETKKEIIDLIAARKAKTGN